MTAISWTIIAASAALSCLFAACNYALRTFNRVRMEEELTRRGRNPDPTPMLDRLGRMILTTATLRILFNVLVILGLAHVFDVWSDRHWALHLAITGVAAFLVMIVFSVAVPNAWARYAGEPLLVRMLPALRFVSVLLTPVTGLLTGIDELVRRLSGAPRVSDDLEHVERQILSAVSEG
ncbi:MAG: DUF21 domain-containing protein, partial [Phycisphaerae bacterium]|nr:DUF21 domain-containing protein [Phycisphaerae bacterium]